MEDVCQCKKCYLQNDCDLKAEADTRRNKIAALTVENAAKNKIILSLEKRLRKIAADIVQMFGDDWIERSRGDG